MTATADAPDATTEDPWQRLQHRLDRARAHVSAETGSAIASFDTHLARLAALRRQLSAAPAGAPPDPGRS